MQQQFNFLRTFTSLFENTEVPPKFAIWCGIGTILAKMENRIWIDQGIYKIYPNFYFVLVAGSGQKKSTAIRLTGKLLKATEDVPRLVAQRLSKEQLISDLAGSRSGLILCDEMATFVNQKDYDAGLGPMLIKLYDMDDFEYKTHTRGSEKITDCTLSMLGGSTAELLRNALPRDAIGGGFTSRIVFVYEDKRPPPVPWLEYDERTVEVEASLIDYLNKLSILEGPVKITTQAKEWYMSYYKERYYNGKLQRDSNLKGYENRRHTHLFKVAMALMLSENPSLTLSKEILEGANILLEDIEQHMSAVMDLVTSTDVGSMATAVWQFIVSVGEVSRAELTRNFSHKISHQELSRIVDTLVISKKISIDVNGRSVIYKPSGKGT